MISGEVVFVTNFLEPSFLQRLQNQPSDGFMVKKSSYIPPCEVGFLLDYAIVGSYAAPSPFLRGPQYFGASEEVESQLSELAIDSVSDHLGKPGPVSMMMEMADSKVLLNNIADF